MRNIKNEQLTPLSDSDEDEDIQDVLLLRETPFDNGPLRVYCLAIGCYKSFSTKGNMIEHMRKH